MYSSGFRSRLRGQGAGLRAVASPTRKSSDIRYVVYVSERGANLFIVAPQSGARPTTRGLASVADTLSLTHTPCDHVADKMDIVLEVCDRRLLTPYVYPSSWPEDSLARQALSLWLVVVVGGFLLYISTAWLSYIFLFDKRLTRHPLFLPNQIRLEIAYVVRSVPFMAVPTVVMFLLEVRGYSRLYDNVAGFSDWTFLLTSVMTFLMFTDGLIYWIHRLLHSKLLYKSLHKAHHKWKVPTPFASHAFHPLDGFLQSFPYHLYPFLFPLHKVSYLLLFVLVNIWTVSIHDGNYHVPEPLKPFINGSAHHTDHHLYYNYNYGQFFTLWDRLGGSFRLPRAFEGNPLVNDIDSEQPKDL